MAMNTTLIHEIDWLVAWDAAQSTHVYLRNADLAFSGNTIDFVGWGFSGQADRRIDGQGMMVVPGLISLHSHPWSETLHKGYIEDFGNSALGMMAMYDTMPGWVEDQKAWLTAAGVAYCELLQSGVTTLVDISPTYDGWLDQLAISGLRGVVAPSMASAYWYLTDAHRYSYHWFEDDGESKFAQAMVVIDAALDHPSSRLWAMIFPAQVDTCTEAFFNKAKAAAAERNLPLQTHAAQSEPEYREMIRRYGKSPIAWLDDIGWLGPQTTVGHGIFMDHHSWIEAGTGDDIKRMADCGASVAHSPTVFMRTAAGLEHFAAYRYAGVNVALATDTFPNNMLEELRLTSHLARVLSRKSDGRQAY